MSDLDDLYNQLYSLHYGIGGDHAKAQAFARAFLTDHARVIADELHTRFPPAERARSDWADGWMSAADYIAERVYP